MKSDLMLAAQKKSVTDVTTSVTPLELVSLVPFIMIPRPGKAKLWPTFLYKGDNERIKRWQGWRMTGDVIGLAHGFWYGPIRHSHFGATDGHDYIVFGPEQFNAFLDCHAGKVFVTPENDVFECCHNKAHRGGPCVHIVERHEARDPKPFLDICKLYWVLDTYDMPYPIVPQIFDMALLDKLNKRACQDQETLKLVRNMVTGILPVIYTIDFVKYLVGRAQSALLFYQLIRTEILSATGHCRRQILKRLRQWERSLPKTVVADLQRRPAQDPLAKQPCPAPSLDTAVPAVQATTY